MAKFSWYLKRLKVMKPAEIVWRLDERIRLCYLFSLWKRNRASALSGVIDPLESVFCSSKTSVLPDLEWDLNLVVNNENDLLAYNLDKKYFILNPTSHNTTRPLNAINIEVPKSG